MKTFKEYIVETKINEVPYDKSDMDELIKLIGSLEKKLDSDESYEEFFVKLDSLGLDVAVSRSIDNAVGSSRGDIRRAIEKGLADGERKEGTEQGPALALALSTIKKLIKSI